MSEVYDDYASPQYLGKSGVTLSCLQAMAAILTSAFHPKKITVVIGQFGNESIMRVLFLVWDWFYPGITIISDGFGTHGGEGGAGLSTALGLIQFYNIPLLQVWIHDETAFDELAHGVNPNIKLVLLQQLFTLVDELLQKHLLTRIIMRSSP